MKAWQHYRNADALLTRAKQFTGETQTGFAAEAVAHLLAALVVLHATDEPNADFPADWEAWREIVHAGSATQQPGN